MTLNPFDTLYSPRPAWFDQAECRSSNPRLFFPGPNEPVTQALKICAQCPVRAECAEMGATEHHGVWGGESARTRNRTHHGTVARYNGGCRCDNCTQAASTYRARYRATRGVA